MGFYPAPFMANIFLYYHGNKRLLDTKTRDIYKVHLFSNTFRFIELEGTLRKYIHFSFKSLTFKPFYYN